MIYLRIWSIVTAQILIMKAQWLNFVIWERGRGRGALVGLSSILDPYTMSANKFIFLIEFCKCVLFSFYFRLNTSSAI